MNTGPWSLIRSVVAPGTNKNLQRQAALLTIKVFLNLSLLYKCRVVLNKSETTELQKTIIKRSATGLTEAITPYAVSLKDM